MATTETTTRATTARNAAPGYVRMANKLVETLLRAGVKISGFGRPMYMLTVRGRKSGQPRTTPVVIIVQDGQRYLVSPFGLVDWVRNLRAAGEATITRGRRAERVRAIELPQDEGGRTLQRILASGIPGFLAKNFEIAPDASPEEFEQTAAAHPVFRLEDWQSAA